MMNSLSSIISAGRSAFRGYHHALDVLQLTFAHLVIIGDKIDIRLNFEAWVSSTVDNDIAGT